MGEKHKPTLRGTDPEDAGATQFLKPKINLKPSSETSHQTPLSGPPEVSEGQSLGRFENPKYLAEGGMGKILTATDPEIGRRVAIKILHPELASDQIRLEKFRNECRITGLLEHPNIVPVHEAGQTPSGQVYFSMKLVHGKSLAEHLSRNRKRISTQRASADPTPFLRHLLKVCDALSFAHSRGVVHRDLKPENLMIGQFGEVLVMDWGLARSIRTDQQSGILLDETNNHNPMRTLDGTVQGTPAYMSPEQAWGDVNAVDEQSDIYSLGAILYEIATGTPPQTVTSTKKVLERVRRGEFVAPRERSPQANISPELEAVILKAMAHAKEDRYPNVVDFQSDIRAYLDGRALEAANYTPFQLLKKWVARNRKVCSAVGVVVLLSTVLFTIQTGLEYRSQTLQFEEAQQIARNSIDEVGTITPLTTPRDLVDSTTGLERKDTPKERIQRKHAIREYVTAARALDRALLILPGRPEVVRQRLEIGQIIGKLALQGGDYLLARQSFLQLEGLGLPEGRIEELVASVDLQEKSLLQSRKKRIQNILEDLDLSLARPGRPKGAPLLEDYYAETLGYRDLQTVNILGENLRELVNKSKEETPVAWSQSERDRATFICRILGRLGFPQCVKFLGEWMERVADHELAVEAGLALCNTRRPEAESLLRDARDRLGLNSQTWQQIAPFVVRLPTSDSPSNAKTAKEYLRRGIQHRESGQPQRAIEDYTQAIQIDPEFAEAYSNRGNVFKELGDFESAMSDFDQAIRIRPKLHIAYLNRGLLFAKKKDVKSALRDYSKAIEIHPGYSDALSLRGWIYLHQRELKRAQSDFERTLELDPNFVNAHMGLGAIKKAFGNLDAAIRHYNQALVLNPRQANAYYNRGLAHTAKNDQEASITDYTRAIELKPKFVSAYLSRGEAFERQGNLNAALVDFNKAIQIDPNYEWGYLHRADLHRKKKRFDAAIKDLTRALKIRPRWALAYNDRAHIYRKQNRTKAALADYNRAIRLQSDFWKAFHDRGQLYLDLGRAEQAIEDFNRALQVNPKHTSSYLLRGDALLQKKDFPAAVSDYSRVLSQHPKHSVTLHNRGLAYKNSKKFDAALQDFSKAIEVEPNDPQHYFSRGLTYQQKGDTQAAIADYNRTLQIDPKYPEAHANLGYIHNKMGSLRQAIQCYQRALEVASPDWHYRKMIESNLEKIRKKLSEK